MKPLILTLIFVFGVLALMFVTSSCTPIDPATPNPLDTPATNTNWHSPAWGTFGPGGEHVPYRPELNVAPQ